jgi:hypothetical protein
MANRFARNTSADRIRSMPELPPWRVAEIVGCSQNYVSVIRWRDKNRRRFNDTRNRWLKRTAREEAGL